MPTGIVVSVLPMHIWCDHSNQGFIQDFHQEGANVAIVKLKGGGEDLIVFLGFVGEGIMAYGTTVTTPIREVWWCSPRKALKFMISESVSGGF